MTRTTLLQGIVSAGALALSTLAVSQGADPVRSPAELARFDFRAPPAERWELPSSLREISGLAVDSAGRVFAHDDERAIIYQLDPAARRVVKRFSFGHPAARGDFEAIAVADNQLILTTSDGVLYAGREGADGEAVPFTVQATGAGRLCEIEGMVYAPGDRALLFACKEPRTRALHGHFTVLRWSLERKALDPRPSIFVPLAGLTRDLRVPGFHPSELVRLARSGRYLVLASRESAIAELTGTGDVVAVARLRHRDHPQAEGLAVANDGALLVADEGGSGRGTLNVYRPR
ncbi:MAG: hypothetical protein ACREOQ_20355 [Gemmatimonadales bacterium]